MTAMADALMNAGVDRASNAETKSKPTRKRGTLRLELGRGSPKPDSKPKPVRKPQAAPKAVAAPQQPKKAKKGKKPKYSAETHDKATALLKELAERFPKTFGKKHVPLARGIYHDVRAATGASALVANCALERRCHTIPYHKAMLKPGAERLELGGRPVEAVNDDDRAFSKKKLEIRLRQRREWLAGKQRRAERQAAQRAGELRIQAKRSSNKR